MNEHLNSFYQKAREHNDIANDLFRKYDIKKGLRNEDGTGVRVGPVSYTHLDVYKRQVLINPGSVCYGTPHSGYAVVEIHGCCIRAQLLAVENC